MPEDQTEVQKSPPRPSITKGLRERYAAVRSFVKDAVKTATPPHEPSSTSTRQAIQKSAFLAADAANQRITEVQRELEIVREQNEFDAKTGLKNDKGFF